MTVILDLKTLYEIDDSLWLEETIELLKAKRFDALDLENLIEELDMCKPTGLIWSMPEFSRIHLTSHSIVDGGIRTASATSSPPGGPPPWKHRS